MVFNFDVRGLNYRLKEWVTGRSVDPGDDANYIDFNHGLFSGHYSKVVAGAPSEYDLKRTYTVVES